MTDRSQVTLLLRQSRAGDKKALDTLVPLVYGELHSLAHSRMKAEHSGHTLNTTGLVHEAYLRLVEIREVQWRDRAHFMAVASGIMRRVLVDYARRRAAEKRGGGWARLELQSGDALVEGGEGILELDEALKRLAALSERQSRLLELRYFGGLKLEECAEALAVSLTTVKRDLRLARAWLARELDSPTT